jgi:hypothetical protein
METSQLTNSDLLTADEAAALLRMTPAGLAQKRLRGCGPPYYQPDGPGSKVFYRRDELEKWIESGRREGGHEEEDSAADECQMIID